MNIEKSACDSIALAQRLQIEQYEAIVVAQDSTASLLRDNNQVLKDLIERTRPKWYQKFTTGYVAGVLTFVVVLLVK